MASFENHREHLAALGAKVVAASADAPEHAREIARSVNYPIAYGVTPSHAASLGAWWGAQRNNIQPAEFLISQDGKVVHSLYASGPVGRMAADEMVRLLTRMAEIEKK